MLDKIIYPFLLALTGVGYLMLITTKAISIIFYPIKCIDWYILKRRISYIKLKIKRLINPEE